MQVRKLLVKCGGEKLIPLMARKGVTFKQLLYADHKTLSQVRLMDYSLQQMKYGLLVVENTTVTHNIWEWAKQFK